VKYPIINIKMPPKRMTANPVKAPRYRPGKAVVEQDSSDSETNEEDVSAVPIPPPPKVTTAGGITVKLISMSDGKFQLRKKPPGLRKRKY
jgi:hypothetical protein